MQRSVEMHSSFAVSLESRSLNSPSSAGIPLMPCDVNQESKVLNGARNSPLKPLKTRSISSSSEPLKCSSSSQVLQKMSADVNSPSAEPKTPLEPVIFLHPWNSTRSNVLLMSNAALGIPITSNPTISPYPQVVFSLCSEPFVPYISDWYVPSSKKVPDANVAEKSDQSEDNMSNLLDSSLGFSLVPNRDSELSHSLKINLVNEINLVTNALSSSLSVSRALIGNANVPNLIEMDVSSSNSSCLAEAAIKSSRSGRKQKTQSCFHSDLQVPVFHNNVSRAFELFQTNADVQKMVVSLVFDKAVWKSLIENEKVSRFLKQLQKDNQTKSKTFKVPYKADWMQTWWDDAKQMALQYLDEVREIVEVFEYPNCAGSALYFMHPLISSSAMLSMIVILFVLIKRTT